MNYERKFTFASNVPISGPTDDGVINGIPRQRIIDLGKKTLEHEASSLIDLGSRLDMSFAEAVEKILVCPGRVIAMGVGKSGHIARKIAATLASTGTPAFYVHPGEAGHGDLGAVTSVDVVLLISNSGEGDEISQVLPALKQLGVVVIGITGNVSSRLAKFADVVLDSSVSREACPLNLAPTSSTTAQLALGDAIAIAALDARGFNEDAFARSHPAGAIGRRLLTQVSDVMRTGDELPIVGRSTLLLDAMQVMSRKGLGSVAVVGSRGRLEGVFTDGDLRRCLEQGTALQELTIEHVMNTAPKTMRPNAKATDAVGIIRECQISTILIVDDDQTLVGAVSTNDLIRHRIL